MNYASTIIKNNTESKAKLRHVREQIDLQTKKKMGQVQRDNKGKYYQNIVNKASTTD